MAHAAATTVNISVTALCKRGGREQTKYQGKAAQEGEKSLQIHHTPFFLKEKGRHNSVTANQGYIQL